MMMTDAAIVTLDESWRSTLRRVSSWFRPSDSAQRSMESIGITSSDASAMAPFVEDAISDAMDESATDTSTSRSSKREWRRCADSFMHGMPNSTAPSNFSPKR